ncbi:MAG: SH3 domain-containing protein [Nitrospirota bacterium]
MKRSVLMLMAAAIVLLCGAAYALEPYYVQSVKAKIMTAPSFKATALGEAGRGTKLTAVAKEGSWIKVSYFGQVGYVSSILVSPYPPLARQGLIKAEGAELRQGVRRRASTYTSAAAARGLAQDDRRRLSGEEKSDYVGLETLEAISVSDAEIDRFMEAGK